MSDTVIATGSNSAQYASHPEGQYVGQCVDVIDLGERVEEGRDYPAKLMRKCALVFRTGEKNPETGDLIDISTEFTVSMGEKANLRRFLESWRGKAYTPAQVSEGVPLHKLTGQHALLTVAHQVSQKGRTYAKITAAVGVPKAMSKSCESYDDYERAPYWEDRKREYAEGAAAFRAANAAPARKALQEDSEFPAALKDDDDDLPF
jgi:hypothetical protein